MTTWPKDDPWLNTSSEVEPFEMRSHIGFQITVIENVKPLDAQFDVWPYKMVPDTLYEPLFGQPEPTENTAPMKTYAVLNAAKVFALPEILSTSGLKYHSLFDGVAAEDYRNTAPYLVELDHDNNLTRILFTHMEDVSEAMTSVHMWHKEPGIYIRSRSEFDDVRRHLRKFTRVQDDNGKWFYFSFWQGYVLLAFYYEDYFRDLAQKFMTPFEAVYAVVSADDTKNIVCLSRT